MMSIRVIVEIAKQLLSDHEWKLHNRVKPSSLKSVFQQIESRKFHTTLRSAERAPTLSADGKVDQPFSKWRGVFLIIEPFVVKKDCISFLDESRWACVPC